MRQQQQVTVKRDQGKNGAEHGAGFLHCPREAGPDFSPYFCPLAVGSGPVVMVFWVSFGTDHGFSSMGSMDGLREVGRLLDAVSLCVCALSGERARAVYLYRLRFTKVIISKAPAA